MAEGELPAVGAARLRGNDAVPLVLACRTVAKGAAKLATGAESNEAEVQVRALRCLAVAREDCVRCWDRVRWT